jgi:hypothetical protein
VNDANLLHTMTHDPGLVDIMSGMVAFFITGLEACACIGLATLAVTQFADPFVRSMMHLWIRNRWIREAECKPWKENALGYIQESPIWLRDLYNDVRHQIAVEMANSPPKTPPWEKESAPTIPGFLPFGASHGQYMKLLQAASDAILSRPMVHVRDFLFLTEDAGASQQAAVLALDWIATQKPELLSRWTKDESSKSSGVAEAMTASRDAVSLAAERNLDRVQMGLETRSRLYQKITIIVVAVYLSMLASYAVSSRVYAGAVALGLVAGLMTSLVSEWFGTLLSRRR